MWWVLLAALLGFYYVMAAREPHFEPFVRWSGWRASASAAAFMVLLVLLGKAGPALLLFAATDLAAAGWTFMALRSSAANAWASRSEPRQA